MSSWMLIRQALCKTQVNSDTALFLLPPSAPPQPVNPARFCRHGFHGQCLPASDVTVDSLQVCA